MRHKQDQAASQLATELLRLGQGCWDKYRPPSPPICSALPGGPGAGCGPGPAMESMFEDDISILTQEAPGAQ